MVFIVINKKRTLVAGMRFKNSCNAQQQLLDFSSEFFSGFEFSHFTCRDIY